MSCMIWLIYPAASYGSYGVRLFFRFKHRMHVAWLHAWGLVVMCLKLMLLCFCRWDSQISCEQVKHMKSPYGEPGPYFNSDSKFHGANMGPIWGRQDPGGAHVGPMNFAIWEHWYCLSRCKDSHYKDERVMRSSYLCNENPYIDKKAYLYWSSHQLSFQLSPKPKFILVPTSSLVALELSWQKPEVPLVFCDKGCLLVNLKPDVFCMFIIFVLYLCSNFNITFQFHKQQRSYWDTCDCKLWIWSMIAVSMVNYISLSMMTFLSSCLCWSI